MIASDIVQAQLWPILLVTLFFGVLLLRLVCMGAIVVMPAWFNVRVFGWKLGLACYGAELLFACRVAFVH